LQLQELRRKTIAKRNPKKKKIGSERKRRTIWKERFPEQPPAAPRHCSLFAAKMAYALF
jgi:hypothetical protein